MFIKDYTENVGLIGVFLDERVLNNGNYSIKNILSCIKIKKIPSPDHKLKGDACVTPSPPALFAGGEGWGEAGSTNTSH